MKQSKRYNRTQETHCLDGITISKFKHRCQQLKKTLGDELREMNMIYFATNGKGLSSYYQQSKPQINGTPKYKGLSYSFTWLCLNCGKGWYVHEANSLWKYCPYCGTEITTTKPETAPNEHWNYFAITYYVYQGLPAETSMPFFWQCNGGKDLRKNMCLNGGYTEYNSGVWRYCPICGDHARIAFTEEDIWSFKESPALLNPILAYPKKKKRKGFV